MGLNDGPDNLNEEQIRILRQQEEYGKMILAIGRGTWRDIRRQADRPSRNFNTECAMHNRRTRSD